MPSTRRRARRNLTARQYEKEVEAERAKRAAKAKKTRAPRRARAAAAAAPPATPAKRMLSAEQKAKLAAGRAKYLRRQAGPRAAAHRAKLAKRFKRVPVKIGGKTVRSYAYRTSTGRVRKIPLWALVGAKSKKDLAARAGSKKGFARRVAAAEKARKKQAAKILLKGDLFTPNRRRTRRTRARAIPYATWSDTMKMNPRRRRRARRNKIGKHYVPKALRGRGRHTKLTIKRGHTKPTKRGKRRKGARSPAQRQATARMLAARWGGRFTQRKAWKNKKRKAAPKTHPRRKLYGAALKAWRKKRGLKVSGAARRTRRNPATENRRRRSRRNPRRNPMYSENMMYNANRRRHGRRRGYRRNPDIMASLKSAFKTGAVIALGFIAHRGLSNLVSEKLLTKVDALNVGGSAAGWRGALGGAIVALAGIPLVAMVAPDQVAKVGAGMVVDFLYQAFMSILSAAGQPTVAGYFGAYPDAEGKQFHTMSGYGSYELMPPGYAGYGSYELMPPGYAGFGQITQAAAGYGAITQAAAGMGAITQAAAGMGEYVAQGVQGYGEYEATSGFSGGFGAYGAMDEGIPGGNTHAAERALSVAEAAAGLGDISLVSTVNPDMIAAPIMDAPGGSRAGVFQGGDGIFG